MKLRVLHCPTSTGGNAWALAQAEREIGLDSDVMVFSRGPFGYNCDIDLRMATRSAFGKALTVSAFLARAAVSYDVIHFNFGRSLLSGLPGFLAGLEQRDLPLLRALGKGIVVTYQGCDVRQRGFCESRFDVSACTACGLCDEATDAERARRARVFDRYADAIFALNPDLLRVLPERAEFLPYTSVDPREWVPPMRTRRTVGEPFRILHSPTDRAIKGTASVVSAVERLKARHPNVELVLVENVPHSQVRALYEQADVAVDQLLIGWYGGFAVEAMALGTPVVCFLREADLALLPPDLRADIPIVNATSDTLEDVLERLYLDPFELARIGGASRAYVERWHDPIKIARHTKEVYSNLPRHDRRSEEGV